MIDYDTLNDYELVDLAQESNEDAINLLHQKYQPIIKQKCRKFVKYLNNKGIELCDLIQEGNIAIEIAIQKFNQADNVSFYTYVNLCIEGRLMSMLRKSNRIKYKILNDAMPLEMDNDETNLIDIIEDNSYNPELELLTEEKRNELYITISEELTDFEDFVFNLKVQGFNYKEIADILDRDIKSIDNAIQRIKIKIKSIINKNI